MCNCKGEMEQQLASQFMQSLPVGAENVAAELRGYGLLMGANQQLEHKNQVEVQFTYSVPGKEGMKAKKQRIALTGNFCMFCGERYSREHAPSVD